MIRINDQNQGVLFDPRRFLSPERRGLPDRSRVGLFKKDLLAFIVIVMFVLSPGMASAAVIRVPTALFPTLQEGIDAAGDGDTVLVADGTYNVGEGLDFKGKAITIRSDNGAGNGINGVDNPATIANCTTAGNEGNLHGGLFAEDSADVTVKNTTITHGNTPDAAELADSVRVSRPGIAGSSGAPLFAGNGDYHLSANSPCIDAGTANGAPGTDIENNSRPQGRGYDIGAYEYEYILYCPQCTGDPVELEDTTFEAGTVCRCSATTHITIGNGVYIEKGANITFEAPKVIIRSAFHADNGAEVRIKQK